MMRSPDLDVNVARAEKFKNKIKKYINNKDLFNKLSSRLLRSSADTIITYQELKASMVNLMKSVSEPIHK
jgi:hypothetical protein